MLFPVGGKDQRRRCFVPVLSSSCSCTPPPFAELHCEFIDGGLWVAFVNEVVCKFHFNSISGLDYNPSRADGMAVVGECLVVGRRPPRKLYQQRWRRTEEGIY